MADSDPWTEEAYVDCLRGERARYAWVMRTYGGMSSALADEAAGEWYPYEPPGTPYRGLVFHNDAWHWAMLQLRGAEYWRHPEWACPPQAYHALD